MNVGMYTLKTVKKNICTKKVTKEETVLIRKVHCFNPLYTNWLYMAKRLPSLPKVSVRP